MLDWDYLDRIEEKACKLLTERIYLISLSKHAKSFLYLSFDKTFDCHQFKYNIN